MKYNETKTDNNILKDKSDYKIAKLVKCDPSYVNLLRRGKRTASWEFYKKLKRVLTSSK